MYESEKNEIITLIEEVEDSILEMKYSHIKSKSIKNFRKYINNKGFYYYGWYGFRIIGLGFIEISIKNRGVASKSLTPVMKYIADGEKFKAIKSYRAWANSQHIGLFYSKKAVERLIKEEEL